MQLYAPASSEDTMDDFRSNPDSRAEAEAPAPGVTEPDDALVADPRGGLSPAQMVDRKLASLMHDGTLPVSRFQATVLPRTLS